MKTKKWWQIWTVKRCDECGRFNPPELGGNPRLCKACAVPDGMYAMPGETLRAIGKINYWKLQIPIQIRWKGWWKL